jgi:anaerobic dimethyl sulfoxide reductase subunit C (anchor subunit)
MTHEWPLIAFTLMSQMAVGAFLLLKAIHFFARRASGTLDADRMMDRALLAIGPVLFAGMIFSLFHLGDPLNAAKAFNNIGSSWLSREILMFTLFVIMGGVFAVLQWRKIGSYRFRGIFAWIAAILGLGLIYCMAKVYLLRTVPTWNLWITTAGFFNTAFLLGAMALGVAYLISPSRLKTGVPDPASPVPWEGLLRGPSRGLAVFSIVLLCVQSLLISLRIFRLATGEAAAREGLSRIMDTFGPILAFRCVLIFAGILMLSYFLKKSVRRPDRNPLLIRLACTAFVLVLASEVLGRFLFYASYQSVGL